MNAVTDILSQAFDDLAITRLPRVSHDLDSFPVTGKPTFTIFLASDHLDMGEYNRD